MKKTILMATSALVAAGFAVEASAVDVEMYGQVNKGVLIFDDGETTEFNIVDNDGGSTRIGVKGSQALDNGLTASVLFEAEMQSNESYAITQNSTANQSSTPANDSGASAVEERHARVGLAGDWGAVFVGRTSAATDGMLEVDHAGASDVMSSSITDLGGGLQFRNSTTNALTGTTVGNVGDSNDGVIANVVRYDSPIFNGLQGRISAQQGGTVDAAVHYNGKYDAFMVSGALGYIADNDNVAGTNTTESVLGGSLSVKHDSGLAGTFAYSQVELENKTAGQEDPSDMYFKVGYSWDAFEVAADYAIADNKLVGQPDHELNYMGVAGQYNLGNGVSMAAYYKHFDLDLTGTPTDEVAVYGVNMRVKY
jgi:predicted porin